MVIRLGGRTFFPSSSEHHDLLFRWHVHSHALRYREKSRAGRSIPDFLIQPDTLTLEAGFSPLERSQLETFAVSITPAGYYCRRHENECDERAGNDPPAALYASLRHARRRALRARGFRAVSSSPAVIDFR